MRDPDRTSPHRPLTIPHRPLTTSSRPVFATTSPAINYTFALGNFPLSKTRTHSPSITYKNGARDGWGWIRDGGGGDKGGDTGGDKDGDKGGDKSGDKGGSGEGDGEEAPPPDIASGGYELRAAFELWGLDAASLVAGPERPSAKYTIFAPGRHGARRLAEGLARKGKIRIFER